MARARRHVTLVSRGNWSLAAIKGNTSVLSLQPQSKVFHKYSEYIYFVSMYAQSLLYWGTIRFRCVATTCTSMLDWTFCWADFSIIPRLFMTSTFLFGTVALTHWQHIAITLQTHCQHIGNTLATHCEHIANTLPTHCEHIDNTLATHWQHVANTLPTHCQHIANPR